MNGSIIGGGFGSRSEKQGVGKDRRRSVRPEASARAGREFAGRRRGGTPGERAGVIPGSPPPGAKRHRLGSGESPTDGYALREVIIRVPYQPPTPE
ncbi:MAG: hypothetical protein ACR2N0_11455 [Rubrobacteraceae bacterium]|nr:hypothetical protein [Rubrobacter sp.]